MEDHSYGPSCEVCCSKRATVFCRNDNAFLCDACNATVHISNPLAARHEVVPVTDEVDPSLPEPMQSSLAPCADLSRTSSTSDHTALKASTDDALFDSISDLSVLDLFSVGNLDTSFDDFQTELEQDLLEVLEKESSQPLAAPTPAPAKEPTKQDLRSDHDEPLYAGRMCDPPTSQAGAPPYQTWNCGHDAIPGLPLTAAPVYPPAMFQFLMTPFCPPMATGPLLMPQAVYSHQALQDSPDRKAKVARYREKRKHRTFENKIRYASRKLYAESRPRIKGRFARPDELEAYLKSKESQTVVKDGRST